MDEHTVTDILIVTRDGEHQRASRIVMVDNGGTWGHNLLFQLTDGGTSYLNTATDIASLTWVPRA